MVSYEVARCAVCGGADTAELAGWDDVRAESELLWQFHMRRLKPEIPATRLVDRLAFSQHLPWRIVRCRACGLVYRNPAEKRETLRSVYASEVMSRETLEALFAAQRASSRTQVRRLTRLTGRRGTGLEVGSYVGAFLAAARAARWQFEGLDVNPVANAFARSHGFIVHDGDIEHFRPDRQYDAVAIWNTFDQLPDPRAALRAATRLLRPGGLLAMRVPNGRCYAMLRARLFSRAAILRATALYALASNNLLAFPYRYGFTPESVGRLLRQVGLHVARIAGSVLTTTSDEWTKPWAVAEERLLKPLTRVVHPWFEVYARTAAAEHFGTDSPDEPETVSAVT